MKQQVSVVDLKTHPLQGVSLIEASAGTGKTYAISHIYVRCLLETGYKVNQLLVVTFTNAATQELKGRIRKLVYQLWNYLSHSELENKQFGELFAQYRNDEKAIFALQEALINFDEAAIYSIHGFCQRVLNSFPVETGSLLQQQIIADEKEIQQSAIRDYWRKHIINTKINKLRWIISHWKDPDDLLNDVKTLLGFEQAIQQNIEQLDNDNIFEKSAHSWQQLSALWLNSFSSIETFLMDSTALKRNMVQPATVKKLLQEVQGLMSQKIPYNLPQKWQLLTRSKLLSCLKKNLQDENIDLPFFQQAEEFYSLHEQWLSQQKLQILLEATESVQKTVYETKSESQNISFNDLISELSDVLTLDNIPLINKINELYPIAMVDEFQDTDHKQYHIFKMLYQIDNKELIKKDDKTLILIGDPKQAIYSFRGADVFTYQQAKESTSNHYTLQTNYRSTAAFINVVNRVFETNKNAFIFDQLIKFSSSKANTQKPKSITINNENIAPLVSWIHPFTKKPLSKGSATEYFADLCASEIESLLMLKTMQLDGHPVEAKDLAILVKTGKQAAIMKNKLAERGISCALILRDSVFITDQAREISLLLEVLINPSNIRRLCGLLSTDLFGWNAKQIYQLQKDNEQLVNMLETMKEYQQHWQRKGILSLFFQLMDDQDTLQDITRHMDGERRVTNWIHIVELLQQQANRHASFSQALHWLLQQRQQARDNADNEEHQLRLESDSDLVRIVTIHKSKGLQYPVVFLPFMWAVKSNRYQPKSYSYHDQQGNKKLMILDEAERERWHQENLAEEVRLFYVAITRAIYRCYLGWGYIQGAGSSAIAQCLFSDHIIKNKYPHELDISNENELLQPFVALNEQQENVEIIFSADDRDDLVEVGDAIKADLSLQRFTAKIFSRNIQQQWRISSYSQIASSGLTEEIGRPDYDAVPYPQIENEVAVNSDELNRFTFYKGAKAGNFLHDILENQAFDQPINEQLIIQKCSEYGFEEKWVSCLIEWMTDILNCDLSGFRLSQLKAEHKISEMEFYMTSKNFQSERLNELLHQHQYSWPQQKFTFATVNGFLKGFIDLVFEFNGAYFIADYKSNYLGATEDCYTQQGCNEAMYDHHYHLQYLVYTLALHRFLKQRIDDYDYDKHFGGVYYLFLRGLSCSSEKQNGVYFHKPPLQVIEQLDGLFNNE